MGPPDYLVFNSTPDSVIRKLRDHDYFIDLTQSEPHLGKESGFMTQSIRISGRKMLSIYASIFWRDTEKKKTGLVFYSNSPNFFYYLSRFKYGVTSVLSFLQGKVIPKWIDKSKVHEEELNEFYSLMEQDPDFVADFILDDPYNVWAGK